MTALQNLILCKKFRPGIGNMIDGDISLEQEAVSGAECALAYVAAHSRRNDGAAMDSPQTKYQRLLILTFTEP
jgi:hypothetical protein